jgi:DNA-binding beta-propeller fold protein YncE
MRVGGRLRGRRVLPLTAATFALAAAAGVILGTGRGLPSATAAAQYGYVNEWIQRYDGAGHGYDSAAALGVSPNGSSVFVTGESYRGASSWDYATVAYDAGTGMRRWTGVYNGLGNGFDAALALDVSPDSSKVFVTGQSNAGATGLDFVTIAHNAATGAKLWVKRYNGAGSGYDSAFAVGVSPDGSKVFVTGESNGGTVAGSPGDDYATVAYDAATGAVLWTRRYDGPAKKFDRPSALAVSPDGSRVFVTGDSTGSTTASDYATVAYDASTGAQLWAKRYNGPGNSFDSAHGVGVSPDGSKVFVTGASRGAASFYDYATVAYNAATGAGLWANRYNGTGNGFDSATAVGVSPDGSRVFVTGESSGGASLFDVETIAYNAATGGGVWARRYNSAANSVDATHALGVSPDGSKLFVTGMTYGATEDDYLTIGYLAGSGQKLWARTYNGPPSGTDIAYALGLSPDGSALFVAGVSEGYGSADYATLQYAAG